MLGPRMHPGGFVFIFHLKDGVGDEKFMFRAQGEESKAIAIYLPRSMRSNYSCPEVSLSVHSCIEVTHKDELVRLGDLGKDSVKGLVEGIFDGSASSVRA